MGGVVIEFLTQKVIQKIPLLFYSSDSVDKKLDAIKFLETFLKRMSKNDFTRVFAEWQQHYDKTIALMRNF